MYIIILRPYLRLTYRLSVSPTHTAFLQHYKETAPDEAVGLSLGHVVQKYPPLNMWRLMQGQVSG
jgi:hypothetical protein